MRFSLSDDVTSLSETEFVEEAQKPFQFSNNRIKINKAVIIAAGNGSRLNGYQNHRPKPLLNVAGLPLLKRVILSGKRNGVTEFVIVIGYQAERIRQSIHPDELGVKITWVVNKEWKRQNGVSVLKAEKYVTGNFFLFMSDHIFDYRILEEITYPRLGNDYAAMLCVDSDLNRVNDINDATKVYTRDERLLRIGKNLDTYNAIDIGIFVCTPKIFDALRESQAAGDESLSGGIRVLADRGEMATVDIGDRVWQDVDTISDVRYAEKLLLHATRSPKDGIIARTINRPISNFISKWLVKTPFTPNQLSFLNFLLTLFVAWLVAGGRPVNTIIGGFLFQFASIFDGCDGEVATLKLKDSRQGAMFDTIMDYLSYIVFIIGVTIGAYHTTHNSWMWVFMAGIVIFVVIAVKFGLKYLGNDSGSMKDFAHEMNQMKHENHQKWYLKFFSALHHIGRRDMFSFLTMLIMFSGSIVLYYWMMIGAVLLMCLGITLSALYFMSTRSRSEAPPGKSDLILQNGIPVPEEQI